VKEKQKEKPSHAFEYLVKNGMDEQVALELDAYAQKKEKRRKRLEERKEDKWK